MEAKKKKKLNKLKNLLNQKDHVEEVVVDLEEVEIVKKEEEDKMKKFGHP